MFDQYTSQKHRGSEGFGLFNGTHIVKAALEERIVRWLSKENNESPLLMFHHRFPTSTINVRQAAHPFSTKEYFGNTEYILIHNGVITNDGELFTKHQELGIDYQSLLSDLTFNDSEALLWDFALTMEGKQTELQSRGQIALICAKLVDGALVKLLFGRNSSPLYMDKTEDHLRLSSEGQGEVVQPNRLYTWDYKDHELTDMYMDFHAYTGFTNYSRPYDSDDFWGGYNSKPLSKKERRRLKRQRLLKAPVVHHSAESPTSTADLLGRHYSVRTSVTVTEKIENLIMGYLLSTDFKFKDAYWNMEADYTVLESEADDSNNEERELLQKAIWALDDDPEFVDDNSVSTKGAELWKQLQTV